MAEAQFTPANINPNGASSAATTMMSLFERGQRMRMTQERAQQAQELHELSIQAKEQGLATGALNFESEKLKLGALQAQAKQTQLNEDRSNLSVIEAGEAISALEKDLIGYSIGGVNPNWKPDFKKVTQFQQRIDALRNRFDYLINKDPARGRIIGEELGRLTNMLNPMANQVKEANVTRFGEMSTELVTLSSGTNTDPGSVRRELVRILTKYADLAHINPEVFKGLKDDALKHIQTLEKHAQEQRTAQAKALAAAALLKQKGLQEKDLQAEKPLTEEEKAAIREHEEKVHNNKVMIEEMKQSIQNLKDEKIRTGPLIHRTARKFEEYFFGERAEEKILDTFATTRWTALVSQLKGALSDKEGKKFEESLPNRRSKPEIWITFLEKQVANLEWYNARDPNAKPDHTEGGTAALQSVNLDTLSGGQPPTVEAVANAPYPPVSPPQDETDYGPFGDNVNNLQTKLSK